MSSTEQDLRELLADRSAAAPAVPERLAQVQRRVRRRQLHQLATGAAAAGLVAAAVIVLAGGGLHRAGPLPPTQPSPTSTPRPSPSTALALHLLAGSPGQYGFAEGTGATARFSSIRALAVGPTGTLYVSDYSPSVERSVVRAITPAGEVTTIADVPATRENDGFGALAVDASGTVYVAEGQLIRTIGPNGHRSTFAGGPSAPLPGIDGMAFAATGDLYAVVGGNSVRKVTPDGTVSTLRPSCPPGVNCLGGPFHIAVSPSGTIYLGSDDYAIRTIAPDGQVRVLAAGAPNVLFSRMSIAFDPVRSLLWVLDTTGLHTVAADGTVSKVLMAGGVPAPMGGSGLIAVGADGSLVASDELTAVVTLTPGG